MNLNRLINDIVDSLWNNSLKEIIKDGITKDYSIKPSSVSNFLDEIFNRENAMLKVCNQLKFNISSNTYESVEFIKYWHTKIDDDKIKKICDEIT